MRVVEMSLAAQSYGITTTAGFLAEHLSKCGRLVQIVRLKETNKSPEQLSTIGLDRADSTAIRTLLALSEVDADHNHSKASSGSSGGLEILANIFAQLSVLQPSQ